MALDINTLQRLTDITSSKWGPQEFALFGIPPQNQKTGTASQIRKDLNWILKGIERANQPNKLGAAATSIATNYLTKYPSRLAETIQKLGGIVPPIPAADQALQIVQQRASNPVFNELYTPVQTLIPTPTPKATPAPAPAPAPAPTPAPAPAPAPVAPPLAPQPAPVAAPLAPQPAATQPLAQPFANTSLPMTTAPTPAPTPTPVSNQFLSGVTPGSLQPENLPALRGGASGTSSIDPTLRPYLELGLRGAEQLFLQQQPSLYPGQMYVGPSQQTLDALAQQEQIARSSPSALQAAQESYMRGLGGLSATAGGAFLMGNPYMSAAIEAASRPIQRQFAETTLPGIASGFSRAGRYGSQAMGTALGQATEATARALGDVGTNIAYGGYEAERARQQQAMGAQLQAATLAPQIYGQQFLPSQQLAQVGAAREAIASQPLQEAIQRYQFQQQIPYQQLQGFLSSVYGTPMASSQYAPPGRTNTAANVLGSAALGAGIGNMIGGSFGGFSAPVIGAGLGALGGLLF